MRLVALVANRNEDLDRRRSSYRFWVRAGDLGVLADEVGDPNTPVYFRRRQTGEPYLEIELDD